MNYHYKIVIATTHSFKFTVFLQNRSCSKEILTIIIIPLWFRHVYIERSCYMTTSLSAIHFFYDNVIISREHLKQFTCQGNCVYFTMLFATIHYNKRSVPCVKSVRIRSFFWSEVFCIRTEYGPEKAPYLDTFHLVEYVMKLFFVPSYHSVRESENQPYFEKLSGNAKISGSFVSV